MPTSQTPTPDKPAIQINNLKFSWPGNREQQPILDIPDWQIAAGQRLFMHGPSGSGKSTLLNIIAGIVKPNHGSIHILGQEFSTMRQGQRDKFRARHLGIIFQQFNLIPYLSVADNITLSGYFAGIDHSRDYLMQLLDQLKLSELLLTQSANQLSVGQQQRVAVARALYHQPAIIIADEPTSALDTANRDDFIRLLLTQSQTLGSSVIFVSHDQSLAGHFDQSIDLNHLNRVAIQHAA